MVTKGGAVTQRSAVEFRASSDLRTGEKSLFVRAKKIGWNISNAIPGKKEEKGEMDWNEHCV